MLGLSFTFMIVMLALYAYCFLEDGLPKSVIPPRTNEALAFEGQPVGPWAYFAEAMAPRKRETF